MISFPKLHQVAESSDKVRAALKEIASQLRELDLEGHRIDEKEILRVKTSACRQFGLDRVPSNSEVLEHVAPEARKSLESKLRRKRVRTASGIAVVTVITKPFDCPHGTCTFCPGGTRIGTPQSYTKSSPATVFGSARNWDPSRQVIDTLRHLEESGHDTSKVELILLGGTVLAIPREYFTDFVKSCYDALNGEQSSSLDSAMKKNEMSQDHRCVGLTIETKPDWCRPEEVDRLLCYGTTRVEIGVQSLREDVLKFVNRGHSLSDTVSAFQVSRDSALKIVAHVMPGLPKSDPDKDLADLLALFEDERYRPDMLKIYPTLVVPGTALEREYSVGIYKPYSIQELKELLIKFKASVPPWVRIMRIHREIPKEEVSAGTASTGNLRQIILDEMRDRKLSCRCIRCREIGRFVGKQGSTSNPNLVLKRVDYEASGGSEVFLSFEDPESDSLHGFVRLRIPSGKEHRPEIRDQRAALIRELHVYGPVASLRTRETKREPLQAQHRGLGSSLLVEAERIAGSEFSRKKLVVISAVGTKEYYRKRGYLDDGVYVSKGI